MNITITMSSGDILISIIISLVAGIITGIVTGYGVTKFYRNKDQKRDIGKYIKELFDYITGLEKIMTYEGYEISDEKVYEIIAYSKLMPIRYNWIKITDKQEKEKILEAENYIKRISQLASNCCIHMMLTKKDAETLKKISNTKQEIFCKGETEGLLYAMKLGTLLKKYINSVDQTDLVEDIRVS